MNITGVANAKLEVSQSKRTIFQMILLEVIEGKAMSAQKIRYIDTIGWLPKLEAIQIS